MTKYIDRMTDLAVGLALTLFNLFLVCLLVKAVQAVWGAYA